MIKLVNSISKEQFIFNTVQELLDHISNNNYVLVPSVVQGFYAHDYIANTQHMIDLTAIINDIEAVKLLSKQHTAPGAFFVYLRKSNNMEVLKLAYRSILTTYNEFNRSMVEIFENDVSSDMLHKLKN